MLSPVLSDAVLETGDVDIALELVVGGGGEGHFGVDEVDGTPAVELYVVDGTAEMVVHGDYVPRLQERPHDYVLSGAALMRGHHITLAEHIEYGLLEPFERLAAGVCIVGPHHGGQLQVAHGVGSAVGQHVQVDIRRIHEPHLLHDTRTVELQGNIYASVELYFRHFYIF